MKKIININLSGRVIPIEDSAYESLQRYIDSLRRYFAAEEGRDEIINDIESRIVELMNDKINKGAAAVTDGDINEIINTMGRVEDFEQADQQEASAAGATQNNQGYVGTEPIGKRSRGRLYRDSTDKILGGVCAGIANYFNIDPAIIRILLVLLIFGAGTGILIYILLWIVLPARPYAKGPSNIKRLFRNPDDRIIGGVAGGIAAYFNKEAWIVRLIFAAPLLLNILFGILNGIFFVFDRDVFPNFFIGSFTGTFSVTYIILWIILPEAKSTYEKMEMRGETVDVNRIKQNVQEGMSDFKTRAQTFGEEVKTSAQNLGSQAREFADTRGRAFASEAAQAAKPIASSLGNIIGLLFKIFLFCILGFFAFIFFIFVIAFVFGGVGEIAKDFLLEGFWQKFLAWTSILLFFGVPMLALMTWLVRRLMKVRTHNRYLGWTFSGLWVLGIISTGLFIGTMFRSFRYYSQSPQEIAVIPTLNKMNVSVNEPVINYTGTYNWLNVDGDGDNGWDITNDSLKISNVKVRIEKSEDSFYHVTLFKYSAGKSRTEAENRAQKIVYNVAASDSILNLGSGFGISKEQKFRGQKVIVAIQVPEGKMIRFDESINERLNPVNIRVRERMGHNRYRREWDMDWDNDSYYDWKPNIDYVMTASGELVDVNKGTNESGVTNEDGVNKDVYEYRRDSIDTKRVEEDRQLIEDQINDQRRRVEEENKRLQELQRKRNKGTTKIRLRKESRFANSTDHVSSPVFSLLVI